MVHGIIESEFPNSSIQWDVCTFQLICISPSYDHFLTENNGYLPLTSSGQPENNVRCQFLLKIWKITGCFLAHLSRRLMGELIVYQSLRRPSVVRRPSVRPQFQTSSPLKPLGQLTSNYIWRLLRTRERKFVQMVLVTWPRWPPRPYMVKTL